MGFPGYEDVAIKNIVFHELEGENHEEHAQGQPKWRQIEYGQL